MKPHPRISKTAKWGGAAVTVLLVVVWVASGWCQRTLWPTRNHYIGIGNGGVHLGQPDYEVILMQAVGYQLEPARYVLWDRPGDFAWWIRWRSDALGWQLFLPLWLLSLAFSGLVALAWHRDTLARRSAKLNLCPKCGYDRTGLAAGAVCPECGHEPRV